ncbi:MAG: glycosyltransferase family 2 protein [Candidatus Beckwithbacteria bacterium]
MLSDKPSKICTVILDYQNSQLTLSTIASIQKAVIPKGFVNQILVVDNSPVPDGKLVKALTGRPEIKLITTLQNTGFAKGNNLGIKYGLKRGCDYFLLINNDVKVDKQLYVNLLKASDQADIIVPKIYFAKGYEYHQSRYQPQDLGKVIWYAGARFDWNNVYAQHLGVDEVDHGQYDCLKPVEFANFCCVLIKKKVIKTIGLLDENYFLYWEDGDYSVRAIRAGFTIVYQPQAKVYHKSSSSSGSGSKLHDYYLTRNRLIFGFKYARNRTKLALMKESLKKLITGREGEKQGIIDFYLHRFGKSKSL